MTVGDLIKLLEGYPEATPVLLAERESGFPKQYNPLDGQDLRYTRVYEELLIG